MQQQFTTIDGWIAMTGMTRSGVYAALACGGVKAIKQPAEKGSKRGKRVLIDVPASLAWLRSQPPVRIGVAKQEAEAPRRIGRSSPE